MGKIVKLKMPSKPPDIPEPELLSRPLSFEKILELDLKHEEQRKRYSYTSTLPHLFQGDILRDSRLIGKVYIYLPLEIDNNIRIKVEELEDEHPSTSDV